MYSQEMHEWLEQRNYSLTAEEYMYITDLVEHPQISAIAMSLGRMMGLTGQYASSNGGCLFTSEWRLKTHIDSRVNCIKSVVKQGQD